MARRRLIGSVLLAGALLVGFVSSGPCSGQRADSQALQDFAPRLLEEPLAAEREQTRIVRYGTLSVAYHLGWRQPQWVAYRLDEGRLREEVSRQGMSFRADPLLGDYTPGNQDFRGTGYSRGHLKPAADSRSSERAMRESFYYTNVSPQLPQFNSGIWNALEMWVRRSAALADALYIATGPCFLDAPIGYMGQARVPVATHFYKALLKREGDAWCAVGFIIPHDLDRKAKPEEFAVSVDSLEALTRIDFFPKLADSIELAVEASFDEKDWW